MILLKVRACDRIQRASIIHIKQDETSAQEESMSARINRDHQKNIQAPSCTKSRSSDVTFIHAEERPRALLQVA